MTHDEAMHTLNNSEQVAQGVFDLLKQITDPATAIIAVGLVAGTTFAALSIEEGATVDEMMQDWMRAVKAQYEAAIKQMNAKRN